MESAFWLRLLFIFYLNGVPAQENLCDVFEGICLNGGTCVEQGEPTDRNIACHCSPEYTGLLCEEAVDVFEASVATLDTDMNSEAVTLTGDEQLSLMVTTATPNSEDGVRTSETFSSKSIQDTYIELTEMLTSTDNKGGITDGEMDSDGQTATIRIAPVNKQTTEDSAQNGSIVEDQVFLHLPSTEDYKTAATLLTTAPLISALKTITTNTVSTLRTTFALDNSEEPSSITTMSKNISTRGSFSGTTSGVSSSPNPLQCITCTQISSSWECLDEDGFIIETCLSGGVCIFVNLTLRINEFETRQVSSGCIRQGIFNVDSGCRPAGEYITGLALPYSTEESDGEVCFCKDRHWCNYQPENEEIGLLTCLKCENLECHQHNIPTEVCNTTEVCVSVDIVVTMTQDASFTSTLRGCMEPDDSTKEEKCVQSWEYAPDLAFQSTGTACFCNTSFCNYVLTNTTATSPFHVTMSTNGDASRQTLTENTRCYTCEGETNCTETEQLQDCLTSQICVAVNITLWSGGQPRRLVISRGCEEPLTGHRLCLSSRDYLQLRPSLIPSGFANDESSGRACFCEEDACNTNVNQGDIEYLVLRITSGGLSDKITIEWNSFVQFDGYFVEVKLEGIDGWITISPFLEGTQRVYTIEGIVVADVEEVRVIAIDQSKQEVIKGKSAQVRRIESGERRMSVGLTIPIIVLLATVVFLTCVSLLIAMWWRIKHRCHKDTVEPA